MEMVILKDKKYTVKCVNCGSSHVELIEQKESVEKDSFTGFTQFQLEEILKSIANKETILKTTKDRFSQYVNKLSINNHHIGTFSINCKNIYDDIVLDREEDVRVDDIYYSLASWWFSSPLRPVKRSSEGIPPCDGVYRYIALYQLEALPDNGIWGVIDEDEFRFVLANLKLLNNGINKRLGRVTREEYFWYNDISWLQSHITTLINSLTSFINFAFNREKYYSDVKETLKELKKTISAADQTFQVIRQYINFKSGQPTINRLLFQ